jgi:hypothetical protein
VMYFPVKFPNKNFVSIFHLPIRAIFPVQLIFRECIILKVLETVNVRRHDVRAAREIL